MSRAFKLAIIAAFASFALTPAAAAQKGIEEVSVRVAYGDLDTSTIKGADTLLKRIESAARKVCRDTIGRSPLKPRSDAECRRETAGSTVARLNVDTLTTAWSKTRPSAVQLSAR